MIPLKRHWQKKMNKRRIVITGIGPITPIGFGKDALWNNLIQQKKNISKQKVYVEDELWAEYYVHKVEGFNILDFGIDKESIDQIKDWKRGEENIDLYYLLAAIKMAFNDSKLEKYNKQKISLVLAHENLGLMPCGIKMSEIAYEMLTNKKSEISKKEFFDKFYSSFMKMGYDAQTFPNLFHVTKTFNINNFSLFINNACASGLYAVECAAQIIKNGLSDIVAIAASDRADIYKYLWFRDLGIYSEDGFIRPFSQNSNGLVFGDGGVSLIIEDFEYAKARGAEIYAEYMGGGFHLENWKITMPQIGGHSYQDAMYRAFEASGISKGDIDFLCPHGVGSSPIDYYEAKAIHEVFGPKENQMFISAFKPYIGHNLGGSALIETAILLLCLKHNIVLPTFNYTGKDSRCGLNLVREKQYVKLTTVMKICCAFAGFNAAAIFKKID